LILEYELDLFIPGLVPQLSRAGDSVSTLLLPDLLRAQRLQRGKLATKHRCLPPVWQHLVPVVSLKLSGRHLEHRVKFLQTQFRGLRNEQVDHDEGDDVETRVETKGTRHAERIQHRGKGEGEYGRPEETGCDRPGHANFAVSEGETFAIARSKSGDR
jgi:hypothetical protein